MKARRHRAALAALGLALAALVPLAAAAAAGPRPGDDAPLAGWTRLVLEGRKFLFASGRSEIVRHDGACGDGTELVVVSSVARVFGARAGEHVAASLMTPASSRTHAWMERSRGKKERLGLVDGLRYTLETYRPGRGGEAGGPWPRTDSGEWRLGDELPPWGPVDPYGLIARLGELTRRGSGEVTVLTKRGPATMRFAVAARETQRHRVLDLDAGSARRLSLDVVGLDLAPGEGGEGETLLNMRGATRAWVEPRSGALVRIEGDHEGAGGRLTMELSAIARSSPGDSDLVWPGGRSDLPCGDTERPGDALDGAGGDS